MNEIRKELCGLGIHIKEGVTWIEQGRSYVDLVRKELRGLGMEGVTWIE